MIHPNATDVWAALSSSAVRTCYDFRTGDSQEEEHPQEPQHAALGAQRSSGAERRQLRGAHPQGTWHRPMSHPPPGTRPHLCPWLLLCSDSVAALLRLMLTALPLLLKAQGPITFSLPHAFDIHPVLLLLTNTHLPLQPLQSILDNPDSHKTPLWYSNALSAGQSTPCLNHVCPWEIFMVYFFPPSFLLFPLKIGAFSLCCAAPRSSTSQFHCLPRCSGSLLLRHSVAHAVQLSRRSAPTAEPL